MRVEANADWPEEASHHDERRSDWPVSHRIEFGRIFIGRLVSSDPVDRHCLRHGNDSSADFSIEFYRVLLGFFSLARCLLVSLTVELTEFYLVLMRPLELLTKCFGFASVEFLVSGCTFFQLSLEKLPSFIRFLPGFQLNSRALT